ncbi:uncharacterized protein LOC130896738 [Diorhabda carinulata]|uniref:uncharacterized protein LOC130449520 n=1 Tax=Diorhabda sublineata TaxID=1163346 RepID=UPI0024E145B4|nr:uncharacterized protein LOC130449520 [Diorhabda sublineata]XP_057661012.1 uncharacterized protein LOC130896738 [Diorhabda carinulata]
MPSLSSPTQSMDTVYPEPMSRLNRRVIPKKRRGGSHRYRTQPVTFSEIQEVDEENVAEETIPDSSTSKSELSLIMNRKFEEFKKTRDIDFILSDKIEEITDASNQVSSNPKASVPLKTCRSIGRLPSRPSF